MILFQFCSMFKGIVCTQNAKTRNDKLDLSWVFTCCPYLRYGKEIYRSRHIQEREREKWLFNFLINMSDSSSEIPWTQSQSPPSRIEFSSCRSSLPPRWPILPSTRLDHSSRPRQKAQTVSLSLGI